MAMLAVRPTQVTRTGLPALSLPGPRGMSGLGTCADSGTCGPNPCTWWDNVWISDACRKFCQCSDPASWGAVGADVALGQELVGAAGVVGSAVGSAAGSAIGGTAQGIGNQLNSVTGYVMIGTGALLLLMLLKR